VKALVLSVFKIQLNSNASTLLSMTMLILTVLNDLRFQPLTFVLNLFRPQIAKVFTDDYAIFFCGHLWKNWCYLCYLC